jgi:hypothetical protein
LVEIKAGKITIYGWALDRFQSIDWSHRPETTDTDFIDAIAHAPSPLEVIKMTRGWIALLLSTLITAGCSGIKVSQDYDPATDFVAMKTYRWASEIQDKTGDPRIDNPLRDTRIRAAIDGRLAEKGFTPSASAPPTFLVRYQYALRQKLESGGSSGGVGFGIGSYGRHGGIAIGTGNQVREYDEGSLTIDLVDADSAALLWRGTGTQRFREYKDPEKASRDTNTLVEKILSQFPPLK